MSHDHHCAYAADLAAPDAAASVHHADLAPLGADGAAPAGLIAPQKGECPELAGNGTFRAHNETDATDCAGQSRQVQDQSRTDKSRATLAAQLALRGYSLFELSDGSFVVSRWNCIKPLADLRAVRSFAQQVGAL
jgi:hypothetical protein